jgi:RNA polymerase sigma-70 factor (ECF subfamily)
VTTSPGDALERLIREEYPRILATLVRVTGDITAAEDAVQDAVVRALLTWPRDGVPREPRAWLTVAARRCAVDRARRDSARDGKEAAAMWLNESEPPPPTESMVRDDLLRLVFTCCHPTLSVEAQVALSLRTLGGLSTPEVAKAMLVSEATMSKRLTRAKQKIAQARIPYRIPGDAELPDRLRGVLATTYLIFNEGYAASTGTSAVRGELVDDAIRLGRLLHELMPDEASVTGLLALMLLHDSRRNARTTTTGDLVLLADQNRDLWDEGMIRTGVELVGQALQRSRDTPDPYVVQAAIAACHALAPSYEQTSWDSIISWYDVLLSVTTTPAAELARASAVAERDGAAAGLVEIDAITDLDAHTWWHAARAELLHRLGRDAEAGDARDRAAELGLNTAALRSLDLSLRRPPRRL